MITKHKYTIQFVISIIICGIFISYSLPEKEKTFQKIIISLPEYEQNVVVEEAELIIEGTIVKNNKSKFALSLHPTTQEPLKLIVTDTVIRVDSILKGNYENGTIIVRTDKGEVDNLVVYCEEYPDYVAGEKVLLMLIPDEFEECWRLKHLVYSKYTLDETSNYLNEYSQKSLDISLLSK